MTKLRARRCTCVGLMKSCDCAAYVILAFTVIRLLYTKMGDF